MIHTAFGSAYNFVPSFAGLAIGGYGIKMFKKEASRKKQINSYETLNSKIQESEDIELETMQQYIQKHHPSLLGTHIKKVEDMQFGRLYDDWFNQYWAKQKGCSNCKSEILIKENSTKYLQDLKKRPSNTKRALLFSGFGTLLIACQAFELYFGYYR